MNPYHVMLALISVLALVAVVPVWMWFMSNYTGDLRTAEYFLATLVLPALTILLLVSWLQPRGA